MLWLQVLPVGLVALTVVYAATSPNDLFRVLALHIPKKPELPVCSFKPQQPLDTIEDEILISFEEWKRQQGEIINRTTDPNNSTDVLAPDNASDVPAAPQTEDPQKQPHFRVPLTDRFNYASSECSARVHLAHHGAKSASSILSSKRDRYMLSPCNAENQFVVVELCEDIRIDTVQLANFEFFSGIFKDFKLSVAKTDMSTFTDVGVFQAKNLRNVQSFHPPNSLGDFYRYIRIDFLSHYGNEFYCPVSLLRVYGLTHLEQWKWDTWEQESKERAEAPEIDSTLKEEPTSMPEVETSTDQSTSTSMSSASDGHKEINPTENPTFSSGVVALSTVSSPTSITVSDTHQASEPTTSPPMSTSSATKETPPHPTNTSSTVVQPTSTPLLDASQKPSTTHTASSSPSTSITTSPSVSSATIAHSNSKPPTQPNPSPSPSPHPHPSQGPGGESIYRTIMNRLTALEANHTLYARYVEQQTSGVREILRRMGEDVGRLEGTVRAQGQVHSKTLRASEERMQVELGELARRVENLRGEIEMEKRIGVAQVCLLAAVLVFIGLTRGSRGDRGAVAAGTETGTGKVRKQGMREWGKRFSSLSGEWRFGRKKSEDPSAQDKKIEFPTKDSATSSSSADERPPLAPKTNTTENSVVRSISSDAKVPYPRSRSHTPSMRTRQYQHQQHLHHPQQHLYHSNPHPRPRPHSMLFETPTRLRTPLVPLQRSSSGFNTGHRSARRWARTAHLHEVRRSASRSDVHRKRGDENDPGGDNPFWDGPKVVGKEKEKEKRGERERVGEQGEGEKNERERGGREPEVEGESDKTMLADSEGDAWVDTDTDLEEDSSYMQVSGSSCE